MTESALVHTGPSANRLGSLSKRFTGTLKGALLKHDLFSVDTSALVNFMGQKDESLTTGEICQF